jgi:hypothetical protein
MRAFRTSTPRSSTSGGSLPFFCGGHRHWALESFALRLTFHGPGHASSTPRLAFRFSPTDNFWS